MTDTLAGVPRSDVRSATKAHEVTASADPLPFVTTALYVGTAGNVTVTMGGASVTFVGASGILPIRVTHVTAATAGDIVALA